VCGLFWSAVGGVHAPVMLRGDRNRNPARGRSFLALLAGDVALLSGNAKGALDHIIQSLNSSTTLHKNSPVSEPCLSELAF